MKYHIYIPLIISILFSSCEKNGTINSVPNFPVHLTLNITAEYPHFVPSGGFQTLIFTQKRYPTESLGYAGVLVYVAMDGAYHANDLACPHCLNKETPIEINGFYAVCPLCSEQYDLSYGLAIPTKGISKEPLKKYTTYYSANGILTVSQ